VLQACPGCDSPVDEGDLFCEVCGADLVEVAAGRPGAEQGGGIRQEGLGSGGPAVSIDQPDLSAGRGSCPRCGVQVDPDGYCGLCGTPVPLPRDHWLEQPAEWVAAMSDRGVRHPHNEDAVAVAAAAAPGSFAALVVCDGVSTSSGSDVASLAAVRTARDTLVGVAVPGSQRGGATVESSTLAAAAVPVDPPPPQPATGAVQARAGAFAARIVDAGLQANAAVVATASAGTGPHLNPPSCTFVAAVLEGDLLVAGWAGDSRAYWLPDAGPAAQLSTDDSWAGEAIAAGIPREDAERAPQAHAITRWFGVDAPDPRPRTMACRLEGSGWVLLCSDGLWNYCSPAGELQGLVAHLMQQTGTDPARLASELVSWAKLQGGHDNITVALARVR
jgi:serine/threonine protein phosphatase PrpC